MKAIIRTFYPDNAVQLILDNLDMGVEAVLTDIPQVVGTLLKADLNVQINQSDTLLRGGHQVFDTIIYVVKKGERFVQR